MKVDPWILSQLDSGITIRESESWSKTQIFEISQFGCGIEINALDFDMHDGDWKCHIADTDKNSSHVKVEAETTLNVAHKSSKS
jgi:hypothetical protein